jgi:glycosyltransferase involved in cell wall biosynthesis
MKLLYITNGITGVGGLERVLSVRASYLADPLGHEVHIASLDEAGREPFYTFSPAVTRHDIEKRHYFSGLRRLVKRLRPDIVSVCDDGLKGFFVPLWLGHRGPFIYERHSARQLTPRGAWLMNLGARLYDRFVVLTRENARQWPGTNVRVIPNPLAFYPPSPSTLRARRIIAVGKVTHHKGYDRLLAAWRLIAAGHPDWRVDIFGSQDDGGELSRAAWGTTLTIHPPNADIEKQYLASSVCALPSRHEGFGMTLIEAMACGVPCVAMDCPCGPRDIIRDGVDGILVPDGDTVAFARALEVLIGDEVLRRKMGTAARRNVRRYDIATVAGEWEKLFNELW